MVSYFVPMVVAAALGQQAPAEAAWLKAIPGDVAVAARVKALESVRDDLSKMLEAMSPNAAGTAQPQLEQGLQILGAQYGQESTRHPIFAIARLPKGGGMPPWAVLIEGTDYEGTLKSISGKPALDRKSLGDHDSFTRADGQTWYGVKGQGFVAFGPDEDLIKAVAKPTSGLDAKLSADHKTRLLAGDLGVYVDVAAIQTQYAAQIQQGEQMFLAQIDQAGAQLPGGMGESVKALYGGMFKAIKAGEGLSFNVDFAAEALNVAAFTSVKADANRPAPAAPGAGELIGRLPADAVSYVFMKFNPEATAGIQKLGLSFLGGGKPSPEMEKGLALQREAGTTELALANTVGGAANSTVTLSNPKDPAKSVESSTLTLTGMKTEGGFVKDVKVTPKAQTYKGFTLNQATMTFDLEKMAANNPGGIEGVKRLMGGDQLSTWYGTDGKTVLSVSARSFDEAKGLIDKTLASSGSGSLGGAAGFSKFRQALPKEVNALFIISAQGLVRQFAQQIGAMSGREVAVPADMPKEPAFLGGSMTAVSKGYSLQFRVPSTVGPVLEKGLVPVAQGLQGAAQ